MGVEHVVAVVVARSVVVETRSVVVFVNLKQQDTGFKHSLPLFLTRS